MTTSDERAAAGTAAVSAFSAREWLLAAVVGISVSLAIVAPFFWLGAASGHDFDFHASSWLEVAAQWKQHIVLPRWHESANHGFGEPRFIFYPPLSWMLGAGLRFIAPWSAVPTLFVVVAQTMACFTAFALARQWLPLPGALAAGAFYAANLYALLVVYVRSDFAEQLASALLPLLFLFAWKLSDGPPHAAARMKNMVLFALVFAAIWLSNAPAAVLASYVMALLFASRALAQRDWRALAWEAGALTLGLGLAAFYILPAAYEQKWVNIDQVLSGGLTPSDNFLYTTTNDPEHTFFNWIASTIAVVLLVMTGAAAAATLRAGRGANAHSTGSREALWPALLIVSGAAAFLMLRASGFAWTLLPKMRFVQFPWRWMLVLAVPCAVFLGACASRRLGALWMAAALAASGVAGVFLARHTWWEPAEMQTLQAMLSSSRGFDGTDEYDPKGDDHEDLPKVAPHVRILAAGEDQPAPAAAVTLQRWNAEEKILRVHTNEHVRLALRLLDYPAWRVNVNGRAVVLEHANGTAQMIVQVPAGNSQIHVQFVRTGDRTIGGVISLLGLVVIAVLLVIAATSGPAVENVQTAMAVLPL
jgi:hypothetical protein